MCGWITSDNAEVVTAWATVAGVVVALVAALAALRQLRMISKDSHDRTRPYVQLDILPGLQGSGTWDLIIENRGASTAQGLLVDAGDLESANGEDHIVRPLAAYLSTPRTLVPGARRRLMWAYSLEERGIRAGVLEERRGCVSYSDERGNRYEDEFLLEDVTTVAAGIYPAPSEGRTSASKDALKDINLAVRAVGAHVGELRR